MGESVKQPFSIGVDGGGTKTELVLLDADGRQVARHRAGGSNPNQLGSERAWEVTRRALHDLVAKAGVKDPAGCVERTLLCMAGDRFSWNEFGNGLEGFGQVDVLGDIVPVLELATGGRPGLVVHGGTGSFVSARDAEGNTHWAGGQGWLFDDSGSGFDIGRRGMRLALFQLQGWYPPTPLAEAMRSVTGLDGYEAITRSLYERQDRNALISGFAPKVFAAAEQGDRWAEEVIRASVTELFSLAVDVARKLDLPGGVPCGLSGPILTQALSIEAIGRIAAVETPDWSLTPVRESPIEGVVRILQRMRGG